MQQETKERIVQTWRERPLTVKIAMIIGMIAGTGIIIFVILGLTGVMENADNIFMPLLGVLMLTQGIREWKTSKITAVLSFAVAIFIAIVACVKWFG
ncbi:MAG: DUF3953 domain-containing protein [Oscillospiraceae bacterium]|nr:DUF3953 domain-containing protein [Oscillospiraceae bacterium]